MMRLRSCEVVLAIAASVLAACSAGESSRADPRNAAQVASGKAVYERNCASCHGVDLAGQPRGRARGPTGRMPAPPHDDSGHTWHHPDDILFGITKFGVAPPYGPPGYQSDMPAFGAALSDQAIWDALAYIKSRWSARAREAQAQIQKQHGG
jgi:mono/diheme cytochrome c family protein